MGVASVTASGSGSTYTYSWNNGQTASSATGLTAGTYTVTVSDNNNCTNTTTVAVTQVGSIAFTVSSTPSTCSQPGTAAANVTTGNPTYTYSWSNGGNTQTISNLSSGTYTVTVTDTDACSQTQTVVVTQVGGVDITLSNPVTICPGANTNLTATSSTGTAPYTYSWSNGSLGTSINVSPAATTTYSAVVTDGNGCTSTQSVVVTVLDNPLTLTSVNPAGICEGENTTVSVTPTGGNLPLTYSWSDAGQTNTSIQVSPLTTSSYTVTATDACGLTASSTVSVNVNPLPLPDFTMVVPSDCYLVCVDFTDASSTAGGTIQSWEWNFGDNGTSDQQNPQHCYTIGADYTISLTVTSDQSCKATYNAIADVIIDPPPVPAFTFNPQQITFIEPTAVYFQNTTVGGVTYWWSFGDSSNVSEVDTSIEMNPSHVYADTGTYCVTLVASNALNCIDTVINCFEITPDWTFYIPNSFTPNGSGVNDVFAPSFTNVTEVELWIFDRWGNQIYHGSGPTAFWNGKVDGGSGKLAQLDTYVWIVGFVDNTNSRHRKVGHVNLIR